MHVLLVHQIFTLPSDGGGTRHFEFAKHLVSAGHQVTVITSDAEYLSGKRRSDLPGEIEGITVKYIPIGGSVHRSFLSRLRNFLWFSLAALYHMFVTKRVDVIYGTSPPLFQSLACLIYAKLRRIPFAFEVRDLWLDFALELKIIRRGLGYRLMKLLEAALYRYADKVIVNSPGYLPYVKRRDVELIENGVEFSEFAKPQQRCFRTEWDLKDNFVCVYLGNMGVANDIDVIMNAADKLSQFPAITILFVGGGMKRQHYENLAAQRGLKNVCFREPVSKQDVPDLLRSCDVGIATLKDIPLFSTPFPNKVFDYMAASVPVVLAISGEIRKVVEENNAGIVTRPGNPSDLAEAILSYYRNPGLAVDHGQNGQRAVRAKYDRSEIAGKLERVLSEMVFDRERARKNFLKRSNDVAG